jgi:hypothetical protein
VFIVIENLHVVGVEPPSTNASLSLIATRENPFHRKFLDPHYVFDAPREPPPPSLGI